MRLACVVFVLAVAAFERQPAANIECAALILAALVLIGPTAHALVGVVGLNAHQRRAMVVFAVNATTTTTLIAIVVRVVVVIAPAVVVVVVLVHWLVRVTMTAINACADAFALLRVTAARALLRPGADARRHFRVRLVERTIVT
jgi:hypothetical protein